MKANVAETKKEFVSFKTELMESLGDFKAKLSQYIQNDVASELQTVKIFSKLEYLIIFLHRL